MMKNGTVYKTKTTKERSHAGETPYKLSESPRGGKTYNTVSGQAAKIRVRLTTQKNGPTQGKWPINFLSTHEGEKHIMQ